MALSERERAEGFFLVPFADGEVALPGLSWEQSSRWALASAVAFGPVYAEFEREWKPGDAMLPVELANQASMTTLMDQIVAYDVNGVLGGSEHIGRALRPHQIKTLYEDLYEYAHPFGAILEKTLTQMAMLRVNAELAARSAGASSSSGSLSPGDSRRERRARSSPRPRSTRSGKVPLGASSASRAQSSPATTSPPATPSSAPTSAQASGRQRLT